MSQFITTAFVQQYTNNFMFLSQQKGSRLRNLVRTESGIVGSSAFYDQIGSVAAQARVTRHGNTPQLDTPHSRRMVTLADYEWADLIDDLDKVRMLADPTSAYMQSAIMAMGRGMDDVIIAAALGSSNTGVSGATAVVLPNTQKLVANDGAATSAFNLNTLLQIKKKFDDSDVDESIQRNIALSSQQLQDLLNDSHIQNHDYNTVRALVTGTVDTFAGFSFVRTQRLPINATTPAYTASSGVVGAGTNGLTNSRSVIAWAQDGLLLGIGRDAKGRITERDDKSYATQVYASMALGATRMEEVKVVQCYCKESNSVAS